MTKGLTRAGFNGDLRFGVEREGTLARILRDLGPDGQPTNGVELKADRDAINTHNVYVEYRGEKGPSGVATSTADWWAFEIVGLDVFVILRTERLRALVDAEFARNSRPVAGGDHDRTTGVLVKVHALVDP